MIKYIGKKHLNSNFYKQVSLKQEEAHINVRAVVDERFKNSLSLKLSTPVITEQIKKMDDYEKVKELIQYFLRNNTICEILQNDGEIIVTSTASRKLVLQLGVKYQELVHLILAKYQNDRLQFVNSCEEENIYIQISQVGKHFKIVKNVSNYYAGICKYDGETALVLTLLTNKNGIVSWDKKFIVDYIKDIIDNTNKFILFMNNTVDSTLRIVGEKFIRIPMELSKEVSIMVLNRNYEIQQMEGKQYKLEGIK